MAVSLGYSETLMSCSASSTSSEMPEEELEMAGIRPGLVRLSIGYTGGSSSAGHSCDRCSSEWGWSVATRHRTWHELVSCRRDQRIRGAKPLQRRCAGHPSTALRPRMEGNAIRSPATAIRPSVSVTSPPTLFASTSGVGTPRASSRLSSDRLPAPVTLPSSARCQAGLVFENSSSTGPNRASTAFTKSEEADFRAERAGDDRKMGIAASERDQRRLELLMLVDVGQLAQVRTQVANVAQALGSRHQILDVEEADELPASPGHEPDSA